MPKPMTIDTFDELQTRDFKNGAVLDEIRAALAERDELRAERDDLRGKLAAARDKCGKIAEVHDETERALLAANTKVDRLQDAIRKACPYGYQQDIKAAVKAIAETQHQTHEEG